METSRKPSKNERVVIYVIVALIIVAIVVFGDLKIFNKSKSTTETPAVTTDDTTPTNPLAQYDGDYFGTSNANAGLTTATIRISNGTMSGTANYVETNSTKVNLIVTGTVDETGNVAGSFSGTGSESGQTAAVNGSYTGSFSGSSINISYSGSGGGQSDSGQIVLNKK
jgi:hypothetical protein